MLIAPSSSPHAHRGVDVSRFMLQVLLAMIPGVLVLHHFLGWGIFLNLMTAMLAAWLFEALVLRLRGRPLAPFLKDYSALITGALLAVSLPPTLAWWLVVLGAFFAIVIAKHVYGGLGYNLFNPAMVGFVVLLIAFPLPMSTWIWPAYPGTEALSFGDSLYFFLTGHAPYSHSLDALSAATPLDGLKTQLGQGYTLNEALATESVSLGIHSPWFWINLAWLAGGLYLLFKNIISWHIPISMLATLIVVSAFMYMINDDYFATPTYHLFHGATMIGAFFIATDPVTSATSRLGKILFGIGVGLLTYCIRTWGGYPDGVAFAVLLMNMAVPLIDTFTQTKVYGHEKRTIG